MEYSTTIQRSTILLMYSIVIEFSEALEMGAQACARFIGPCQTNARSLPLLP